MRYFEGIEWVNFNHTPNLKAWKNKTFNDYYVLNYAHSGSIKWGVGNNNPIILNGPVAWWTLPGPKHLFGRDDAGTWDHYFVAFRGPRVNGFIQKGLYPVHINPAYIKIQDAETFRTKFEELLKELSRPERIEDIAVNLLEGLFIYIQNQPQEEKMDRAGQEIRNLMKKIWDAPPRNQDFKKIAHNISLSYSHFRRLFRETSGLSPQRFLLKARIDFASRLIRNTDKPLKLIAELAGFEDIYYFTKLFKKHYDLPPAKYRKAAKVL